MSLQKAERQNCYDVFKTFSPFPTTDNWIKPDHSKSIRVSKRGFIPVDEGRSSHTRLVRGVRLLQSPSEWTEDTEDGLSPPDRPGPGDLAFRPLERPLPFEDFPPPANRGGGA